MAKMHLTHGLQQACIQKIRLNVIFYYILFNLSEILFKNYKIYIGGKKLVKGDQMAITIKQLNKNQIEQLACTAPSNTRQFLSSMLALEDPFRGIQVNIGKRRFGVHKETGRVVRPDFVPIDEARAILKGEKEHVVALGNGGHSPIHEPDEWFAGSVFGMVNGSIPFTFSERGKEPLIYSAPTLVLGRGTGRLEVVEVRVDGPVKLGDVTKVLRDSTNTKQYGILEIGSAEAKTSAQYAAVYTYAYTYTYGTEEHSVTKQSNEPVTLLLSANSRDTHAIRESGENVHINGLELPESAHARGILFKLS